tara:strand:+ start:1529 stop:2629 length:1101 start_codon:yes stop_codon:yes gene_type:complete
LNQLGEIIFLTSEFPPMYGGIGSQAFNIYKELSKNNYTISIIAPFSNSELGKGVINKKDRIFRYGSNPFLKIVSIIFFMIKLLLKNRNSTIIASGQLPVIIIGNLLYIIKYKSIAIIHGHESIMGKTIRKKIFNFSIKQYDRVIAVSSFSKNIIKATIPQLDVSVINNGIDINRFKIFSKNKKKINGVRLLTIGSLTERKGQKNIIDALPLLKKKFDNVFYQMVGKPVLFNEYQNLANSYGVQELIKIHSVLPDDLMVDVIYDSNIFIMLSNNLISGDVEGFGIAILEANYFGLPAIGSKNCGIEDAICDKKTGRLINPNNPNELVEAIEDILANYQNYSEESKKWALSHDWCILSKAYLEMISGL